MAHTNLVSIRTNLLKGIALTGFLLLTGCGADQSETASSASQPATSQAQQQLLDIKNWWQGDYNNDRQVARLEAEGKPIWRENDEGKGGHIEVTSHYRSVELPEFGEHVIYVEETKYDDPDSLFRQRIYSLYIDPALDAVRVKLWYFNDKEKYVGAWKDLSRIKDLKKDEMFPLPDTCDLTAQKQGDKYHMPMPAKKCVFGERYFDYQVLLGENSFWFRDRIVNVADDKVQEAAGGFTYHELDKIK